MHSKPSAGGWRPQEGFKNGVLDQQCLDRSSLPGVFRDHLWTSGVHLLRCRVHLWRSREHLWRSRVHLLTPRLRYRVHLRCSVSKEPDKEFSARSPQPGFFFLQTCLWSYARVIFVRSMKKCLKWHQTGPGVCSCY